MCVSRLRLESQKEEMDLWAFSQVRFAVEQRVMMVAEFAEGWITQGSWKMGPICMVNVGKYTVRPMDPMRLVQFSDSKPAVFYSVLANAQGYDGLRESGKVVDDVPWMIRSRELTSCHLGKRNIFKGFLVGNMLDSQEKKTPKNETTMITVYLLNWWLDIGNVWLKHPIWCFHVMFSSDLNFEPKAVLFFSIVFSLQYTLWHERYWLMMTWGQVKPAQKVFGCLYIIYIYIYTCNTCNTVDGQN